MPCYHPLRGWQAGPGARLSFGEPKGVMVEVGCGQCVGCRLEHSRQWAVRCVHESQMWERNSFITLTYDDMNLPYLGTLLKRDWQLFAKRLRKQVGSFRFMCCGEYGEESSRPHYHACIFGLDFPDRKLFKDSGPSPVYTSDVLSSVWKLGHCTVGDLTFESAAYVARYVMKKVTSSGDFSRVNFVDGEVYQVEPEFGFMSRRPGLGSRWFERWRNEVYPSDEVVIRGRVGRPPRYYDLLQAIAEPDLFELVKAKRIANALEHSADFTPRRLLDREVCVNARVDRLKRVL